jgi:hypothetical protein
VSEELAKAHNLWRQFIGLQRDAEIAKGKKDAEIKDLKDRMAQIAEIANIPPIDNRYGSLAVRMGKVWLLSRSEQKP